MAGQSNPIEIDMFVSDTLANGSELAGQILTDLNDQENFKYRDRSSADFDLGDVLRALVRLLAGGRVIAIDERSGNTSVSLDIERLQREHESLWFELTPSGRDAWRRWRFPD